MPRVGVSLEELARETEALSPADLKSLAQEAALAAMTRSGADDPMPAIEQQDFPPALERHRVGTAARAIA
jgi:ATP-dependent 26S proteasome regulatory subunit